MTYFESPLSCMRSRVNPIYSAIKKTVIVTYNMITHQNTLMQSVVLFARLKIVFEQVISNIPVRELKLKFFSSVTPLI